MNFIIQNLQKIDGHLTAFQNCDYNCNTNKGDTWPKKRRS
jgi:hypothetical protein